MANPFPSLSQSPELETEANETVDLTFLMPPSKHGEGKQRACKHLLITLEMKMLHPSHCKQKVWGSHSSWLDTRIWNILRQQAELRLEKWVGNAQQQTRKCMCTVNHGPDELKGFTAEGCKPFWLWLPKTCIIIHSETAYVLLCSFRHREVCIWQECKEWELRSSPVRVLLFAPPPPPGTSVPPLGWPLGVPGRLPVGIRAGQTEPCLGFATVSVI